MSKTLNYILTPAKFPPQLKNPQQIHSDNPKHSQFFVFTCICSVSSYRTTTFQQNTRSHSVPIHTSLKGTYFTNNLVHTLLWYCWRVAKISSVEVVSPMCFGSSDIFSQTQPAGRWWYTIVSSQAERENYLLSFLYISRIKQKYRNCTQHIQQTDFFQQRN